MMPYSENNSEDGGGLGVWGVGLLTRDFVEADLKPETAEERPKVTTAHAG